MPVYCYKCASCTDTKEVDKPMSQSETQEFCDTCNTFMLRDLVAEHGGTGLACDTWPMTSDAAGVSGRQVKEATEEARKAGVPTEFTPDGRVIFTGPQH